MKRILVFLFFAALAAAQPALVTITGPVNNPDGSPWTGTLSIQNPAVVCGGVKVAQTTTTVAIVAGVFQRVLSLYPIADCGFGGYSYAVRSIGYGANRPLSYWVIHASSVSETVAQVEVLIPPGISATTWGGIGGVLTNQSDLTTALGLKEPALGNPGTNGYILSSTAAGVRGWVAPQSGAQGIQGIQGATGAAGAAGAAGATGPGVATGGTTNQILAKNSNTNFDTKWEDAPTGTGTVTHTAGSLTTGYLIVGNSGADIAATSGLHTDESGVLTSDHGFKSGDSGTGGFYATGMTSGNEAGIAVDDSTAAYVVKLPAAAATGAWKGTLSGSVLTLATISTARASLRQSVCVYIKPPQMFETVV